MSGINTFENNHEDIENRQAVLRRRLISAFAKGAVAGLLAGLVILLLGLIIPGFQPDAVRTFTICIGWCGAFSYCVCLLKLLLRR